MKRINLLCPTIYRQSRKVGRNEPCPCGATKFVEVPILEKYFEGCDGEQMKEMQVQVPVKFKHCHGDSENIRKAAKIQNFFRRHFTDILNRPRKASKLHAMAEKVKSLFKFGRK